MPRRNHPKHMPRKKRKGTIYYQEKDFSSLLDENEQNRKKRCQSMSV